MADKKFTLFHLSLIERAQLDFEMFKGSREDWLRFVLDGHFSFQHYAVELHWVPQGVENDIIIGIIQRLKKHSRHDPPELGGQEIVADEWQGAYVLVDPTSHIDGQKAAVENDVMTGQPTAILKSLIAAINGRHDAPYHVEVEPLFDSTEFWEFSALHQNELRWIEFDFVVPNMWGTKNNLDRDLRDTGKETGAQRVKVRLDSTDGVRTQSNKVQDAVGYVERGAGKLKAKALNGDDYSSDETVKTTAVAAPEGVPSQKRSYLASLKDRIFGREQDRGMDMPDGSGGASGGS